MSKIIENNKTVRVLADGKILCTQCHEYLPKEKFAPSQQDGWGICKHCFVKRK
jgi:formylmethanofuran dehydrogenase subunit E